MLVGNFQNKDLHNYIPIVGKEEIFKLLIEAEALSSCSLTHVNSTSFGGGVAELLYSLVPLMNSLKIKTEWEVLEAPREFYKVTKKIHNNLQGRSEAISTKEVNLYKEISRLNAQKVLKLKSDVIVIHDPQPIMLKLYKNKNSKKWLWRCHIDLSTPNLNTLRIITEPLKHYNASIFHLKEFIHPLIPTRLNFVMPPSIDPLSDKNKELKYTKINRTLNKYDIDPERPILLQVSRFDPWKDIFGVIDTYRVVRERINNAQLVIAGSLASDDPEGSEYLREVLKYAGKDKDIHILSNIDGVGPLEINAFQRAATVILQLSIREGFGLVVTEALWKRKPVVARPSGGIKIQVIDGVTGYWIRNLKEAASKVIYLIKHPEKREALGERGRDHVLKNFIVTKHLMKYVKILKKFC